MLWALVATAGCAPAAGYSRAAFERHIRFLASDELKGRNNGTPEGLRAAQYVADEFAAIGLRPAGVGGAYYHDFELPWGREAVIRGRNVAGLLEGASRPDEVVLVAAHHDGRGVISGRIQNGADDNASGVAMILELARALAARPPARSVLFASFDAEENGLAGSRAFVKAKVADPERIAAMVCFDLIGGDFVPGEERRVYALGSEYSAELWDHVGAEVREAALEVRRVGIYLIEMMGPRSDYGPFRDARVPFVFLSTGTPWYYHTEYDDLDRINYAKMAAIGPFCERLIRRTADGPRPRFRSRPETDVRYEAAALRDTIRGALASGALDLTEDQRVGLEWAVDELDVLARSEALPEDARARMTRMMTVLFGVVRAARPRAMKKDGAR